MRTQVAILGAGPAGLLLGALLAKQGIASVILEAKSRDYVEARIRAGVLEQGTVNLLHEAGAGARLAREGLVHEGTEIALEGVRASINFKKLTGKTVTVYGQTEVVKDLITLRLAQNLPLHFNTQVETLEDVSGKPVVIYTQNGQTHRLEADFIAGCDGFHGISRRHVPTQHLWEKIYPFAWLGVLAHAKPVAHELIYARSQRGFGLYSMRSESVVRHYIQCKPDENLADWPDEKVFDELELRLGASVPRGAVFEKSVLPMRSFIHEPMRYGKLFLCGDAAHIVPPTGAKGLNLAASDVHYLSQGLTAFYHERAESLLEGYSAKALARVWKASRFSYFMTTLFHTNADAFEDKLKEAECDYLLQSPSFQQSLAENYVGLPF
jgi:p-hydroxybenzoate 3-monooxygenase